MRILLLSCFMSAIALNAQDFVDVFKMEYRLSPENQYQDSTGSPLDIHDVVLSAFLPFEQDDGSFIIFGSTYQHTSLQDLRLHSLAFMGGMQRALSRDSTGKWENTTVLIPKINRDPGKIVSKDVQIGLYSIFSYRKSPDFRWKFGLYANNDLFGIMVIPLVGLAWKIDEDLTLDMTLPVSANLRYVLSDKWMAGLTYTGRKYSYNLARSNEYVEVGDNTVGLFLERYLTKRIVLNAQAGHSVLRNYDRYDEGQQVHLSFGAVDIQDDRKVRNSPLSQSMYFKGGLYYRFSAE
jgi:hypothetical protein